ncbi:MAG: BBP7 family outer membrane beta-barrel protein [Planctomycetota bacterium]|jgi:hypothetical protein
MSRDRLKTAAAAWAMVLLTTVTAVGQSLQDFQPFALADMNPYGGGYRPNEGFFFAFDGLLWSISNPDSTTIGKAGDTRSVILFAQDPPAVDPLDRDRFIETNGLDTSPMSTEVVGGTRYDMGYVNGHRGVLFSGYQLSAQNVRLVSSDTSVVFSDPPFGPSPPSNHLQGYIDTALTTVDNLSVNFDDIFARNAVETWGVELNFLYRMHPNHHGGIFELFGGARYMEIDELFSVDALGGNLADSFWATSADNHVIGPQLGARWFRKTGRWTFATEGRFFAGFNAQSIKQRGTLGSQLDPALAGLLQIRNMGPTSFNHGASQNEWSPTAELRVDARYQLTSGVSARIGWTGIWMDGVARASNLINYEVPNMGIDLSQNRQSIFIHGASIGLELNR